VVRGTKKKTGKKRKQSKRFLGPCGSPGKDGKRDYGVKTRRKVQKDFNLKKKPRRILSPQGPIVKD